MRRMISSSDEVIGKHLFLLPRILFIGHNKPHLKLDVATSLLTGHRRKRKRLMPYRPVRYKGGKGAIHLVCKAMFDVDLHLLPLLLKASRRQAAHILHYFPLPCQGTRRGTHPSVTRQSPGGVWNSQRRQNGIALSAASPRADALAGARSHSTIPLIGELWQKRGNDIIFHKISKDRTNEKR